MLVNADRISLISKEVKDLQALGKAIFGKFTREFAKEKAKLRMTNCIVRNGRTYIRCKSRNDYYGYLARLSKISVSADLIAKQEDRVQLREQYVKRSLQRSVSPKKIDGLLKESKKDGTWV